MKKFYLSGILLFFLAATASAQVNFTANTPGSASVYTTPFLFGSNLGYYPPWTNQTISDIAAGNPAVNVKGVGVKSLHVPLPESFLEQWGYDVSVNDFIHYAQLGIKDNPVFLEYPSDAHKDSTIYPGCTNQSLIWSNLYEPIWDGGANGTPVNENNYFALYVYKTVTTYKSYVKFWEVVNEPDYDGGANGWKLPGDPGNWWDNNPTSCELLNLQAPVFNYIRMMRIAYEVVKSIDPTAYVAMGGTGYPAFYDVMLRNTDNPVDGSVTSDYPATGGAYFDCTSFHYYPMYDLQYYNGTATVPTRYSDAALDRFISRKNAIDSVLTLHGYNGVTYPKKIYINTENNVPRESINGYIGSDAAQINYDMKAIIGCQLHDIKQWYVFTIADNKSLADATDPFDVTGLYQPLAGVNPYNQQPNNSGIAVKTLSDVLGGYSVDTAQTSLMNLPATVRGGAFKNSTGNYIYVLWATTTTDNSEVASANYSFPAATDVPTQLTMEGWDFSQTNNSTIISSQNIALTGSPSLILTPLVITALNPDSSQSTPQNYFSFSLYPNPVKDNLTVKLHLKKSEAISLNITDGAGQIVMQVADNTIYSAGDNLIHLSLPGRLASGIYYCRLVAGSNDQTIKFIVSK